MPLSYSEVVLGGICVSIISGVIGKVFGERGKVSIKHCIERRESCQKNVYSDLGWIKKILVRIEDRINSDGHSDV